MKINDVLVEDNKTITERAAFNDLQPIHIFALKSVYKGKDLTGARDSTLDAVDDLISFGLLSNDEQLTPRGTDFAKKAFECGSLEKREKGLKRRNERRQLKRDDNRLGFENS